MEVLIFQIGVFILIFIVGALGRKARIYICLALGVFTLFAVFKTGLAIIQFITIFIAYSVSNNLADRNSQDGSYNFAGCFKTVLVLIFIAIILSFLMKTCSSDDSRESTELDTRTINNPANQLYQYDRTEYIESINNDSLENGYDFNNKNSY